MNSSLKSAAMSATLCAFACMPYTALANRITVVAFEIDQTEVTVSEFAAFADSVGLVTEAEREGGGFEWGAGWERRSGWNFRNPYGEPAAPDEPAVHISWSEANNYCKAVDGRLPTQKEWASAAYTEQRSKPTDGLITGQTYTYPIGDTPEGMNNNRKHHVRVATTRPGVNSLYDMGANVWEWLANRQNDDALTAGGSWWYGPDQTRDDSMQWKPADFYVVYIGFRCVY